MASDRATLKVQPRTEFGSRTSRRLRRDGLVPGVVYGGGRRRAPSRSAEREIRNVLVHGGALIDVEIEGSERGAGGGQGAAAPPGPRRARPPRPPGGPARRVEIQAEVAIELIGTEDAPGVKEGGVLEHVTHEITIEALPTEIPETIPADVSGMEIGDTLQLSAIVAPEGVEFVLGEDQTPTRSRSPPSRRRGSRRSRSPSSRRRPSWSARRARRAEGEEAARARPARTGRRLRRLRRGVSPCACSPARGSARSRRRPLPDRRARQPGQPLRAHPPQRRLRGRRASSPALGPAEAEAASTAG